MRVLVTGGAGYIGSVAVRELRAAGHEVVLLDDLSTGHREAAEATGAELVVGSLAETGRIARLLAERRIEAVMHFAALALVPESVARPARYWSNNVGGTASLLEAMHAAGARAIVFSSSCSVYGTPDRVPIGEDAPARPESPYGWTKLACERLIEQAAAADGLAAVSLRYFNAAGASADGALGESHDPETHLVPNVLASLLGGTPLSVFGRDYPTRDGTCVRDYIHVEDLAAAHRAALERLADGRFPKGTHRALNLGLGRGFSVLEVVAAAERVAGRPVPLRDAPRRPGDPPELLAEASRARETLGWSPRHASLDAIVESAWRWARAPRYGRGLRRS